MHIDYYKLLNEAMLNVLKTVLSQIKVHGAGDNIVYISFLTNSPFVRLSDAVKAKYPYEITIVLQHQFDNLQINDDNFCVDLSFNNIVETVVVPFNLVTSFMDPKANFSFQFQINDNDIYSFKDEKVLTDYDVNNINQSILNHNTHQIDNYINKDNSDKSFRDTKISRKKPAKELSNNIITLDKFRKDNNFSDKK